MKEQSLRSKRMGSLVRDEIARTLISEVQDPKIQSCTITEVTVTGDLRQARVYFQCHGDSKLAKQGLKRATPFLRHKLGQGLEMKHVPELVFELDTRTEQLHHLMKVMDTIASSPKSV